MIFYHFDALTVAFVPIKINNKGTKATKGG
jgi:hypothetical protein